MRETLGLGGRGRTQLKAQSAAALKQRHRFVQDGEVQVIHMNGPRDADATAALRGRIATLEATLEAEHAARAKAENAAQVATAQIHALETKLAHVEMSARELAETERQAREQAEAELRLAREQFATIVVAPPVKERAKAPRAPKQKGTASAREPQPVKWWLGSAKAKMAAR